MESTKNGRDKLIQKAEIELQMQRKIYDYQWSKGGRWDKSGDWD